MDQICLVEGIINSHLKASLKIHPPKSPELESWITFFSVAALSTWRRATSRCQVEVLQSQAAKAHGAGSKSRSPGPLEVVTSKAGLDSACWISMVSMICFSTLDDFVGGCFCFRQPQQAGRDHGDWERDSTLDIFYIKVPSVTLNTSQQIPP